MTTAAQSTVGTKVYVLDKTVSPHVVVAIDALKGFSAAGGGKRKKIDKSNMDSKTTNEVQGGRIDPAESSGQIVLMKNNASHRKIKKIFESQASGATDNFQVYVGDSDGTAAPTVVTGALVPAQSASPKKWLRSGVLGEGYFSNFTVKYEDDDVIRADLSVQYSGEQTWQTKGEAISLTY